MKEHFENSAEIENLYREVMKYDREGDVYNAVKLCKRIAKLAPDWSAPYAYLGRLYKSRKEWKPVFHYSLKAVKNNPFNDETWSHLALAATALEEWEMARQAWNQLGYEFKQADRELRLEMGRLAVCLNPDSNPEIVEATRIDPVRVVIESIPQPSSGHRYKDTLLIDLKPAGNHHIGRTKVPYFNELEHLKRSAWKTFAAYLNTDSIDDVAVLAALCEDNHLGFDNWSHALRYFQPKLHPKVMEYFDFTLEGKRRRERYLVAIAAKDSKKVENVLKEWEIITLKKFSQLEELR